MSFDWRGWMLRWLFSRWEPRSEFDEGYTILVPSPMDMPFLLRFTLEGLRRISTEHCKQIVVIPDGWADDGGAALAEVIREFPDPRLELLTLKRRDVFIIRRMPSPHWLTVIYGTNHARCEYAFLHDSDAFFRERDGVERIYGACREQGLHTVGLDARWDPFFQNIGYRIPGTWEMMFSCRWLRRFPPHYVRGRLRHTAHGPNVFDTLLYPQYLDYGTEKIAVMEDPPCFVHFNGTIVTYRTWRRSAGRSVVDELFRLLLLSLFEELVPSAAGRRLVPPIHELACGLTDAQAPIRYDSDVAIRGYGEFRDMIGQLCESPIFEGERAQRIQGLIEPFDRHFADMAVKAGGTLGEPIRKFRRSGLA